MTSEKNLLYIRRNSVGAVALAEAKLDPAICDICETCGGIAFDHTPATKFYIMTEFGGFYNEYRAQFILQLCDTHDYIATKIRKEWELEKEKYPPDAMPKLQNITLNELKVLQVMIQ